MKKLIFIFVLFQSVLTAKSQGIGIGTVLPLMPLHVSQGSDSVGLFENSQLLNTGVSTAAYFKTGQGTSSWTGAIKSTGQNVSAARLGFFTGTSSALSGLIERLSVADNGKIGLGTTQPDSSLTVSGNVHITGNALTGNNYTQKLEVTGMIKTTNFQMTSGAGAGKILSSDAVGNAKWVGCGLKIGQTFAGGIIFYLDPSGCHGLVAAPFNQSSPTITWSNVFTNITSYADGISAGDGDTKMIVYKIGVPPYQYAAKLCNDLIIGPYSGWYLPSKYELNLMYWNIGQGASAPNSNIGNFPDSYYWSSTEMNSDNAWYQIFVSGIGSQNFGLKWNALSVRAIRSF